jgi:2OG-Fe(II) oxygenase superfamily
MQEVILNLGKKRANEINIRSLRHYFNLGKIEDALKKKDIKEIAKELMKDKYNIDLTNFRSEIIERDNKIGFYLNWHIDDCSIHKHKTTENKTNNEILNDKYGLYHEKLLPKYTMIIYLTSIDQDFTGGEFEFVDQLIKPKKYDVIFFDSGEVHRVRRLRSGERKNILIKFYEV